MANFLISAHPQIWPLCLLISFTIRARSVFWVRERIIGEHILPMGMQELSRLWIEFKPRDRIDASPLIVQKPMESPDPFHSIYFSRAELKDREDLSYFNKWIALPHSLLLHLCWPIFLAYRWIITGGFDRPYNIIMQMRAHCHLGILQTDRFIISLIRKYKRIVSHTQWDENII